MLYLNTNIVGSILMIWVSTYPEQYLGPFDSIKSIQAVTEHSYKLLSRLSRPLCADFFCHERPIDKSDSDSYPRVPRKQPSTTL